MVTETLVGCGALFCFCAVLSLGFNLLEGNSIRQDITLLIPGAAAFAIGVHRAKRGL